MQKGRLVYIEPNDLAKENVRSFNREHKNVTWNPEDLNLYVDLQVVRPDRNDCGEEPQVSINGTYSNTYISLMEGTKLGKNGSLTTDYTNISYNEIYKNNTSSKEALGITSIDITFDAHFYPKVTMNFTDVRAYSLFMPAEEEYKEGLKTQAYNSFDEDGNRKYDKHGRAYTNFFNAVFHFPYPRFLLTVKGFYGTKVTFILAVETFKSSFNSNTGNFDVSINFIGYMYGIYTDIPMNLLMVAPYIGELSSNSQGPFVKSQYWNNNASRFITENGEQIPTFLEFAKKYAAALENAKHNSEGIGESLMQHNDAIKLLSDIDVIKKKLEDIVYYSFAKDEDGNKKYSQIIDNINCKKYIFYIFETTNKTPNITWDKNKAKELKQLIDNANSTYGEGLLKNMKITLPFLCKQINSDNIINCNITGKLSELYSDKGQVSTYNKETIKRIDTSSVLSLKFNISDSSGDTLSLINEIKNLKNTNKDINNFYFCALDYKEYIHKIDEIKSKVEEIKKNSEKLATKDAEDYISREMGFTPSIKNIFRMVFAHLECFFHEYLDETIYKIKSKKDRRTLKKFGLSDWQTDVKHKSQDGNTFLPPFFAFYNKNDDGQKTLAYPGRTNIAEMAEIEEVKLVEKFIAATKRFSEEYSAITEEIESLSTAQSIYYDANLIEGDFMLPVSYDGGFEPSSYYDAFYGNRNPYSYLSSESPTLLKDIFYLFSLRLYCFRRTTPNGGKIEDIVNNEFNNIIAIFNEFDEKFFNSSLEIKDIIEYATNKITPFSVYLNSGLTITEEDSRELSFLNGIMIPSFDTSKKLSDEDRISSTHSLCESNTYKYIKGIHVLDSSKYNEFLEIHDKTNIKRVLYDNTSYIKNNRQAALCPIHKVYKRDGNAAYFENPGIFIFNLTDKGVNQLSSHEEQTESVLPFILWGKVEGNGLKKHIVYSNVLHDMLNEDGLKNLPIEAKAYYILSSLIVKIKDIRESFDSENVITNGIGNDLYERKITLTRLIVVLYYGCLLYLIRKKLNDEQEVVPNLITIDEDTFNIKETIIMTSAIMASHINDNTGVFNKNFSSVNSNDTYTAKLIKELVYVTSKNNDYFDEHEIGKLTNNDLINLMGDEFSELELLFLNECNEGIIGDIINSSMTETVKESKFEINYDKKMINRKFENVKTYPLEGKTSQLIVDLISKTVCMLSTTFTPKGNNESTFYNQAIHSLYKKLETKKKTVQEESITKINNGGDQTNADIERSLYYTLKNLYDKWICSYGNMERFKLGEPHRDKEAQRKRFKDGTQVNSKREINNFLFVDSLYRDIGETFLCDPFSLINHTVSTIEGKINNFSVYQFLHSLCQENKLLMRAIPVYNNFYTEKGLKEIFTPNDVFNINQWQENGFSSTYLIMYTYQPSTHLEQENSGYVNDGMDIGRTIVTTDTMKLFNDTDKGYAVPTFAVTYGMQNQNYFKSININMDNPITTDYSIANQLMISQTAAIGGDLNLPVGIGQNIYSIYSNRSYTCTVEMMGCANIMPMMYFQLNNIPMFKGAYMITSVKHSIRGGNMTTIFTGVRQTSIIYPFVNSTLILTTLLERLGRSSNLGGTNSRYIGSEAKIYTGITKAILVSKDSSIQIVDKNLLELPWKIHTRGGRIKNYPLGERKNNKITTIILHYTAGLSSEKGDSEKYGASWNQLWNTKYDYEASADFCVDDGQIVQYNPNVKQFYTYSTNNDRNVISIEMCSTFDKNKNPNLATNNLEPNMPQWSFSQKVLDNTQKLIYMLCDEYNDGKMLDIKTHYNKTGKSCPGIVGWNDGFLFDENKQKTNNKNNSVKFNDFVKKVKEGYNVRTNK